VKSATCPGGAWIRNLQSAIDWLFGCPHPRESFPQRRRDRRRRIQHHRPSYRVCLGCGRERDYTLLDAPQPTAYGPRPTAILEVR